MSQINENNKEELESEIKRLNEKLIEVNNVSVIPQVQENISWSALISQAKDIRDEIQDGSYHEDNDNAHYIYETVMLTIFGEDYFKWENKNT